MVQDMDMGTSFGKGIGYGKEYRIWIYIQVVGKVMDC